MFFLRRRRVFIGECDGQAVYYDQKTGEALAAPKSVLSAIAVCCSTAKLPDRWWHFCMMDILKSNKTPFILIKKYFILNN